MTPTAPIEPNTEPAARPASAGISIAMCTYNGEAFLPEQLASLAGQHCAPVELQIGDDRSSDRTHAIIEDFARTAPFPVHLHVNRERLGYGENFIQTARRCRGDWVAFCDQDDVWLSGKLTRCTDVLGATEADVSMLVHDAWIADEALRPLKLMYGYRGVELHPPLALPPEWFCVGFSQVLRRDLLERWPTAPRPSIPGHSAAGTHDVWAALVANVSGAIVRLGEPLVLYRRHGGNASDLGAKVGRLGRLREKFRADPAAYAGKAAHARAVAACLLDYGEHMADPSLAARARAAAKQFGEHASIWEDRAAIQERPTLARRFAQWRALQERGGYSTDQTWPLGRGAALKDAANLLIGRSRT